MIRVDFKLSFAAVCLVFAAGPGLAQSACPCASGDRLSAAQVATLVGGKMACAQVGSETWQEWHNGSGMAGGPVWDYKRGPGHPVDPSEVVGSYAVDAATNTLRYSYGSNTYTFAVCQGAGALYAFCGAAFGGRDIPGVKVGGDGTLQACASVTSTTLRQPGPPVGSQARPPVAKMPAPAPGPVRR